MAPPCRVFQASDLPHEIQFDQNGRRRKTVEGRPRKIDLSACELFSMTQYDCQIDSPEISDSPVRCWPVQRWFRRCQDRKGSFLVETTKWEGTAASVSQQRNDGQGQTEKPAAGVGTGVGVGVGASKTQPDKAGGSGGDWVNDWRTQGVGAYRR